MNGKKPGKLRSLMILIKAVQNGEKEEATRAARDLCGREIAVVKATVNKVWEPLKKRRAYKQGVEDAETKNEEQPEKLRIEIEVDNTAHDA